jgi:site-specific recombinase XerD
MSTTPVATAVEAFAAEYFILQGLSADRQRLVLHELRRLEAHAGAPAETLDDQAIRAYMADQLSGGLHVNTVRKHLHAIRPFYKWCWRTRVIDADHWLRIQDVEPPRGSTSQARPRPYKIAEVQRFWDQLDARWPLVSDLSIQRYVNGTSRYRRIWRHAMHLQTQAVASLALFGGLRNSEIRFAGIDDIHPDNEYIVVRGKSSFGERQGYREVPYTEEGRRMVAEWLAFRALLKPKHDRPWLVLTASASRNNALLPSHPLEPIGEKGWEALITNVGKWELHRFRHTAATEWLRAGVALERVQKLLGHANIAQTLGYAELVRDDVARDVRKAEADFVTAVGRRNKLMVR